MNKLKGSGRGQALVEFAFVAPLLFLLLFSIIEAARFIYYTETLNSATREGARYAIVHGSASSNPTGPGPGCSDCTGNNIKAVVQNYAIGVIRDGDFTINVCWPGFNSDPETWVMGTDSCRRNNNPKSFVKVTMDYRYKLLIPLVPLPNVDLHAESILVINH